MATLKDLITWIEDQGARGRYNPNSARMRITAIERLSSVLGEDESTDPKDLAANIDDIGNRYAIATNANSETVRSYLSRARTTLDDFNKFLADPMSFTGRSQGPRSKTTTPRDKDTEASMTATTSSSQSTVQEHLPFVAKNPHRPSGGPWRTFPLKDARDFVFMLPEGGLAAEDVVRIASHLMTLANDVDPWSPPFRIVKSEPDARE